MGEDTLGIEYTNDPRALREELVDGSVVVKKTMVDVARGVICIWRVVCGERGRGTDSCLGWSVGVAEFTAAAAVGSGGECAMDAASEDADMMRGMSVLESLYSRHSDLNGTNVECLLQTSALRSWAEEAVSFLRPPLCPSQSVPRR